MFKSIKKNYVKETVIVSNVQRVTDKKSGMLTHYRASFHMRLEGKIRPVVAIFYPGQAKKLCDVLGAATSNPFSHNENVVWFGIQVELLDVRKLRLSQVCTAKLISAEFTPATEKMLAETGRAVLPPKSNA